MYINANVEACSYWEEPKQSAILDSECEKTNTVRKGSNISPPANGYYSHFCKDENSVYQYCDRNFNFSANANCGGTSEDDDYHHQSPKRKITVTRDPMSHRIIEKRRRDRMNNCLADLSRLIPAEYLKKGRGRIEKTEIIEMAIKHMKYLQAATGNSAESCKMNGDNKISAIVTEKQFVNGTKVHVEAELSSSDHYRLGYQECFAETMRFLVELQGFVPTDSLCLTLINHLQKYYEKLAQGDNLISNLPPTVPTMEMETKTTDRSSPNEIDGSVTNSFLTTTHHEENYHESCNTHVGEVLAHPHVSTMYISSTTSDITANSSSEPASPQNDNSNDNQSSNGSLYKFKSNIRERFEHSKPDKTSSPTHLCNPKVGNQLINKALTSSIAAERCSNSKPVPIFALHSKGSFYVPLTIDSHLLSPFITELNCEDGIRGFSSTLLHPVTISVNFNRPVIQSSSLLTSQLGISTGIQSRPLIIVPECR